MSSESQMFVTCPGDAQCIETRAGLWQREPFVWFPGVTNKDVGIETALVLSKINRESRPHLTSS